VLAPGKTSLTFRSAETAQLTVQHGALQALAWQAEERRTAPRDYRLIDYPAVWLLQAAAQLTLHRADGNEGQAERYRETGRASAPRGRGRSRGGAQQHGGGVMAQAKRKARAKRTGPSKRTAAQRAAIDKRAAAHSRQAKRAQRKRVADARAGSALSFYCPTCRAKAGKPCIGAGLFKGDFHRARAALQVADLGKAKPQPIAKVLAPLVAATAGHKGRGKTTSPQSEREKIDAARLKTFGVSHYSPDAELIDPALIVVGERHRKDFGDLPALAASINDRGGLIQPIAVKPPHGKPVLIAGERRLRAWALSRFAGQPIPCHFLDVDSIVAGEWDENAQRKDFTPSEAVKIQRTLESVIAKMKAARPAGEKPAPGRRASGEAAGRAADKVGKLTGVKRESLRKARAVVEAAEEDQSFGDLVAQMDKSGSIHAAHKKLTVRQAKAAIVAAPPAMPMNAAECATWLIDFPWAGELEADQEKLDAAGRAFRPYPEMSIKTICAFIKREIVPRLPENVALWLCVTNFVLVRGYHLHVYGALGLAPENAATMLTWGKDRIGRGQILRDQTEHAILLTRGKVTIDVFGRDPPSTLLNAARGENSQKPKALYELIARVTPAKRYAEIFSTGAHGLPDWDCHGDQVGRAAERAARGSGAATQESDAAAEAEGGGPGKPPLITQVFAALDQDARDARLLDILDAVETEPDYKLPDFVDQWLSGEIAPLVAGKRKLKLTKDGRERRDALLVGFRLKKLTREGKERLARLREEVADKAAMAMLPDGIDALVALYGETIRAHHAAVLGNDQAAAEREEHRLELIEIKANGGTHVGMATDDSPAARVRAENRAPIGEVPMWGQEGIFRIAVDGMAAIVHHKPVGDWLDFHAEAEGKPFISETGYHSSMGDGAALGCTVLEQAEALFREEIAMPLNAGVSKREQCGKKNALPLPDCWYRLPVSWAEHDRDHMPEAGGKDLFGKKVKPTPPDEARQIDLEEAIAARGREPVGPAAVRAAEAEGGGSGADISDDVFENADLYRIPPDVVTAIEQLGGHTIAQAIDWDQGEKGHAVATCQCGFLARADRTLPYSGENVLGPAIETHWRKVLIDAGLPGAAAVVPPPDPLDIPPELDRRGEKAAAA
jgi:N6-adenosine-specific RNA methylase IME4/ParB-like chromosome segregation protein Spo0J